MWIALMLVGTQSLQMPLQGGPPSRPPEGVRETRERPPLVWVPPDVRRIESLRVRFEFARETKNTASLQVLDTELATILAPTADGRDGGASSASLELRDRAEPTPGELLARQLQQVQGKYDEDALAARARIFAALLLEARGVMAAPPRSVEDAPAEPPQRRARGRR